MPSKSLYDLTANLRTLGGGRVWSLMISLFGDLAQSAGDVIEGPVLSAIMVELDVKPQAARVALHRLRNDGWITSHKVGRISHHTLTDKGRTESAAASPRIYSTPDDLPQEWQLVLIDGSYSAKAPAGFIQILPRVFAGPANADTPKGSVALPGTTAPDWLRNAAAPVAQSEEYEKLHAALITLSEALPRANILSARDITVLRCLVVHNWRRLSLKHAPIPLPLIDMAAPHYKCHMIVADLLARFPRPPLRSITQDRAAG